VRKEIKVKYTFFAFSVEQTVSEREVYFLLGQRDTQRERERERK